MSTTLQTTKADLVKATRIVGQAVAKRNAIPALMNFRLTVNGAVTLTGSDMDTTVTSRLFAEADSEGECLVDAKRLQSIANALPSGDVELKMDMKEGLTIRAGRYEQTIGVESGESYPRITDASHAATINLDSDDLRSIATCSRFSSTDEFRPAMTGVMIDHEARVIVATDGFRLVRRPLQGRVQASLIVPSDFAKRAKTLTGAVTSAHTGTHLTMSDDVTTITTRLIDEKYPNWQAVIPNNTDSMTVNREALIDAIKRTGLAANEQTLKIEMTLSKAGITINAQDAEAVTRATESVPGTWEHEEMTIGLNSRYAIGSLEQFTGEEVELHFSTPLRPMTITCADDPDVLVLQMPIRLTN